MSARAMVFSALVVHSAEEGVTFNHYRPRVATLLSKLEGELDPLPSPDTFYLVLLLVTAAAALLLWPVRSMLPRQRQHVCEKAIALILLLNVIIPHVPLTVALGGYAPGVVSAVLINAPVAFAVLFCRNAPGE